MLASQGVEIEKIISKLTGCFQKKIEREGQIDIEGAALIVTAVA